MDILYAVLILCGYVIISLIGLFLVFPISNSLGCPIDLTEDEYGDSDIGIVVLASILWPIGLFMLIIFGSHKAYMCLVQHTEHYWSKRYDNKKNI